MQIVLNYASLKFFALLGVKNFICKASHYSKCSKAKIATKEVRFNEDETY